jgi:hypothetical protein
MACLGNDFQHNNLVFLMNDKKQMSAPRGSWVTDKNIIEASIYFAVRHCVEFQWYNDRDQFLYPNNGWKKDAAFQSNCLVFTLFHGQNRISSNNGVNHWIPFTEKSVGLCEKFESNFMSNLIKRKISLTVEAREVLNAGKKLWKYYYKKSQDNKSLAANASFYDIREFFQERNDKGTMNIKSNDETYNKLLTVLREKLNILTNKIQPKVYKYGFLKK